MLEDVKKKINDLGNGIKSFFIAIGGIITAIAAFSVYIFIKEKQNEKIDKELESLKESSVKNEAIIDFNKNNIEKFNEKESSIEEKIKDISNEKNDESLDDFFNKRGF